MVLFNYSQASVTESAGFPPGCSASDTLFIICRACEVAALRDVFGFDESTVRECTNLDESVRYSGFEGYDFISMVHIEILDTHFVLREINLYVSARYLVLVLPEHNSARLIQMEKRLKAYAESLKKKSEPIGAMYFWVFHNLLADCSDSLEYLEDSMQVLADDIVARVNKEQFTRVHTFRNMAFAAKKHLRALSYFGEQILLDENQILNKRYLHYFRNINTRLKKLYDFAESLYNLSGEMLNTYDSRLSMKTNEMVNKLTVVTLFFGPLTVITGIYGMNFRQMPELNWPFGYPAALGAMAAVSLILFVIMKLKKWL